MMTITNRLRKHLLAEAGVTENPVRSSLDELKVSEWSSEFEQFMRNRLIMGAYRYGKQKDPNKPQYDRIKAVQKHLLSYKEDGNTEHLVDIANLALCEFVEGDHPKKHFRSVDDGEHVEVRK